MLLTSSDALTLPTLYTINDIAPIITKYFDEYLGHLNLKDAVLTVPSITLDVVKSVKTLEVSLPYSSAYGYYDIWAIGILKYNTVPNLILFNYDVSMGALMFKVGDTDTTKTMLYLLSQQMEIVQDGFSYNSFDAVLNYRSDPNNIPVLN
jgi:hypothetical protein